MRRRLAGNFVPWSDPGRLGPGPALATLPAPEMPTGPWMTAEQAFNLAVEWDRRIASGGEPATSTPRPKGRIPGAMPFRFLNAANVVIPAIGAEVVVVAFTVPPGRNAEITRIANQAVVGGWNQGTGDLSWRLQIDRAAFQGFSNINSSLGTMALPGDLTESPIKAKENQLVEWILRNNALVIGGANPVLGLLGGYFYPLSEEETGAWI